MRNATRELRQATMDQSDSATRNGSQKGLGFRQL